MDPLTDSTDHLRVLIANERKDRLAPVATIVVALGHEVTAREIDVEDVDKIVRKAACPVIVLLHAPIPRSSSKPPSEACSPTSQTTRL